MKRIFHLSSCSTCQRILKELDLTDEIYLQDIKTEPLNEDQLSEMRRLAGSYDALFSKRSMKYRALGLHEKELSEDEMRQLILDEYTFLKRPVAILDGQKFIGNSKATVQALKHQLKG
jgi:arsenate reductase (glutaredoxin)